MKAAKKTERTQTAAGKACAEGLRLFKVAGRPTKEQVVLVYGERARLSMLPVATPFSRLSTHRPKWLFGILSGSA